MPVFETGAFSHSATCPDTLYQPYASAPLKAAAFTQNSALTPEMKPGGIPHESITDPFRASSCSVNPMLAGTARST